MQYKREDGVVFRVKSVNKPAPNVINRPLIDSTSNVTVEDQLTYMPKIISVIIIL